MKKNPGRAARRRHHRRGHAPTYADILMATWAELRKPPHPAATLVGRNPRRVWTPAIQLY